MDNSISNSDDGNSFEEQFEELFAQLHDERSKATELAFQYLRQYSTANSAERRKIVEWLETCDAIRPQEDLFTNYHDLIVSLPPSEETLDLFYPMFRRIPFDSYDEVSDKIQEIITSSMDFLRERFIPIVTTAQIAERFFRATSVTHGTIYQTRNAFNNVDEFESLAMKFYDLMSNEGKSYVVITAVRFLRDNGGMRESLGAVFMSELLRDDLPEEEREALIFAVIKYFYEFIRVILPSTQQIFMKRLMELVYRAVSTQSDLSIIPESFGPILDCLHVAPERIQENPIIVDLILFSSKISPANGSMKAVLNNVEMLNSTQMDEFLTDHGMLSAILAFVSFHNEDYLYRTVDECSSCTQLLARLHSSPFAAASIRRIRSRNPTSVLWSHGCIRLLLDHANRLNDANAAKRRRLDADRGVHYALLEDEPF